MTKQFQCIKSFALGKSHLWPNYLIMAGLCFKLVSSHIPLAMAEQLPVYNYSLGVIEAIQSPNFPNLLNDRVETGLILANHNFIQAICPINIPDKKNIKPEISVSQPTKIVSSNNSRVTVTAYSSTPDQTDSSPFITANGAYVYDGLVACNFLSFGTKVKFPEMYGDKIFTVEDRMALRNSHKIDIWMPTRQAALQFGVKRLAYEIVE
jgi:3D (Asp-Asp-Asp) domain-containing protein